jgi:hypothetical protein
MEQLSDAELMKLEHEFEQLRDTAARHRGARRLRNGATSEE